MRAPTLRVFALLLLILSTATSVLAQSATATLRGTVHDESGNIFPGAVVTATSTERGYAQSATAGGDGVYVLPGLNPGTYRIEVTAPSYKQASRDVTLLAGQTLPTNFRLSPDLVVMEEITVVGTQAVEMETHEVATQVTKQQIEQLPQNNRNFLNFVALAPGVRFNDSEFSKQFASGAGALAQNNVNVVVDGVSFKNDVLVGGVIGQDSSRGNPFPQNAVQEFRVLTQNFSAEFSKASGAVISTVTKSGTNDLMGDAFGFFQDKGLVAENPFAAAGAPKPEYERMQLGASIGGPIIRDKMHFFLSYESNDEDRESQVSFGTLTGAAADQIRARYADRPGFYGVPFELRLLFGKVTYQPGARHLVDFNGFMRDEKDIRFGSGTTAYDVAEEVAQDIWNLGARYQMTSATWLNEAIANYQYYQWNPRPLNPDEIGLNYEGVIRVGGRDTEQQIGQTRLALRDDLMFTSIKWHGDHGLKVGGNVDFLQYDVIRRLFGNPLYSHRAAEAFAFPYQAQYGVGDPSTSGDNTQIGMFVQDDWTVNQRLTVNLGLRWDYESDMYDTNHVTPENIRQQVAFLNLPEEYFSDGNDREPISDMIAPRFGATYDVFGTAKTVVFGGWGRYYDRVRYGAVDGEQFRLQYATSVFRFSLTGAPRDGQPTAVWDPKYYTVEGLQELMAIGTTGVPETHLMSNNLKAPYTDHWNLGIRQSLGNYVGSLTYANQRGYDYLTMIRGNRRPDGTCCISVPGSAGVFLSSNDIKTWYDAVYLTLERPFTASSRWSAGLSYTYADATPIGGDAFSLRYRLEDWPEYRTANVPEHSLVANTLVRLPWDMTFGAIFSYNSGVYYTITDQTLGTSENLSVTIFSGGQEDEDSLLDLRLEKTFRFAGVGIGLIGEVFNVFDDKLYSGYSGLIPFNSTNPNFGNPTSVVFGSGRRFQYGARFTF